MEETIMDYEQMMAFVKDFFESHDPIGTGLAQQYPFRRRFEHSLRCAKCARQIAVAECADEELVVISALFHDIGKAVSRPEENHGEIGAKICNEYLTSVGYDDEKRTKIVRIVRDHSQHAPNADDSLEEKIVSDADLLDEVGAITVLWDAMACATRDDTPSYDKVYDRIENALARLKTNHPAPHTLTARHILTDRLSVIENFLKNLGYELGRSE
jgi:uncharacterized protein